MAAMQAPCCTSGCSVTLRLRDGKTLAVPRCALAAASPVLREVLSLRLAPPGELELPDDDLDTWQAALKVLVPTRFVKYLANWDDVEPLLMLADKYDMAVVRGHCCHFLANHTSSMDFKAPLDSARNVLRAASLVLQYGGNDEELAEDRQVPHRVLEERLAELWRKSIPAATCSAGCNQYWQPTPNSPDKCARCGRTGTGQVKLVSSVATAVRLLELFKDPRYPTLVASEVQVEVQCTIVQAFRGSVILPGVPNLGAL